jgi:hypothetical protein
VIVDFGLGKIVLAESVDITQVDLTSSGRIVGTIPYMSPEQLRSDSLDAATDIFSFGVVAFETLAGRRPFQGTTDAATIAAILQHTPPSLRSVRADVPQHVAELVADCLQKRASLRPSAVEVVSRIAGAADTRQRQPRARRREAVLLPSEAVKATNWISRHRRRAIAEARPSSPVSLETVALFARAKPAERTLPELLKLLDAVGSHRFSTKIGAVTQVDGHKPRRGEDDIFVSRFFRNRARYWTWAVRKTGEFYSLATLRRYDNDVPGIAVESIFREIIGTLLYLRNYSRMASSAPLPEQELFIQFVLRGASNHRLLGNNSQRSFPATLAAQVIKTEEDEIRTTARIPIEALFDEPRQAVKLLLDDILMYFDFAVVPDEYYDFMIGAAIYCRDRGTDLEVRAADLDGTAEDMDNGFEA